MTNQGKFLNHKDSSPNETIRRIKAILQRIGIENRRPMIQHRFNPVNSCHSVYICSPDYPLLTANGKGVTDEYSLASAYAEYMERLQGLYHVFFGRIGEILPQESMHTDEVMYPASKLWRDTPEVMRELVEDETALPDEFLTCIPFLEVFHGETLLLPYALMTLNTESTGMCAGNTPEEAVTQGICEIVERYISRMVLQGELHAPHIPLGKLPECSPELSHIIRELNSKGLTLIVKDCTINGTLPVLAAIVIDEDNDRFNLAFGCDPVFDVTLQRCITELYQGRKKLPHSFSYWKEGHPPVHDYVNNTHSSLKQLLMDWPGTDYTDAFASPNLSNADYLHFMLNKVRTRGLSLYVRDYSFLGFPTYYVFIEKMSVARPLSGEECRFHYREYDEALGVLFRLNDALPYEIDRMAGIFADKLRMDMLFNNFLTMKMRNLSSRAPVRAWVEPITFLTFLFIETNRLDDALRLIDEPDSRRDLLSKEPLIPILTDYCRMRLEGESPGTILEKLRKRHNNSEYYGSLKHLIEHNYAGLYLKESEIVQGRKFEGLPIPSCLTPFACGKCGCKSRCYAGKFIEVRGKIQKARQPVNQTSLRRIFSKQEGTYGAASCSEGMTSACRE